MIEQNIVERVAGKLARAFTGSAPDNVARRTAPTQTLVEPAPPESGFQAAIDRKPWKPNASAPLSPEAKRELKITQLPERPKGLLDGVPFPSNELLAACARMEPVQIGDIELAAMRAVDEPWMRLSAAQTELIAVTPNQRYRAHLEAMATKIGTGEQTADSQDGWSRADWQADADEKRSFIRQEMRRYELRAWEIAKPIYHRFADAIGRIAESVMAQEQDTAAKFCLPFAPSQVLLRILKAEQTVRNSNHSGAGRPLAMLGFLPSVNP